ncbi:CBS domain-containing protein [Thermodesulfobacterium hydrogeniphilum]|uniref:CBS domain-containing protein n=1 Tax=Thermodesulfobacterium hydrogeniphilum TaxID=161156 RepID=UPI00068B77ED|nr:CBS domain-containing protein [Thermodesulfobacterium hydrogeniphilum]
MKIDEVKVSDVMNRQLITVPMEANFREILETLRKEKVHAVLVLSPTGELAGVISQTDIIEALLKDGEKVFSLTAEDLISPGVYTIEGNASLKQAIDKMLKHKIHRILVVSEKVGKTVPVGILSATDVLKFLDRESYLVR